MGNEVCNTAYNLKVTNTLPGATPNGSSSETNGSFKLDGTPGIVDKVDWSPSGCVFAAHTFNSGSSSGVMATSLKLKSGGKAVMRKGDTGLCTGTFTNVNSGATVPCACTLEIDDAGQTKVRAE